MNETDGNFFSPSKQKFLTKKELKDQARNLEERKKSNKDGEVKMFAGETNKE